MRGLLRPCVPPESISRVFEGSMNEAGSQSQVTLDPSVQSSKARTAEYSDVESPVYFTNAQQAASSPKVSFAREWDQPNGEERDDDVDLMRESCDEREEAEGFILGQNPDSISCSLDGRGGSKRNPLTFFGFAPKSVGSKEKPDGCSPPRKKFRPYEQDNQDDDIQNDTPISMRDDTPPLQFTPEKCAATPLWDIWSFGLMMVQLLLGRSTLLPNFEKADDAIISNLYLYDKNSWRKIRQQVSEAVGEEAADLVARLLHPDPGRRIQSMDRILKHKYFDSNVMSAFVTSIAPKPETE